jgi:hypothetical protein
MKINRRCIRIRFIVGLLAMLVSDSAYAGSKYYKTCGFGSGQPVSAVTSGDPTCVSIDNVALNTVGNFGCITYRVTCQRANCKTNILVSSFKANGAPKSKLVNVKCKNLNPNVAGLADTPCPECPDTSCSTECANLECTDVGVGDTVENPIEVDGCSVDVPAVSTWGVAVMTLLMVTAATIVLIRRRSVLTT